MIVEFLSLMAWTLYEHFSPRNKYKFFRKEFIQDILFLIFLSFVFPLILTTLGFDVFAIFNTRFSQSLFATHTNPVLRIVTYLLIADFLRYLTHNLCHRIPLLWKIHCLHHSTEELTALSGYRNHFLEDIIFNFLSLVPLLFLGATMVEINVLMSLYCLQGHFVHANINVSLGIVGRVVCTPNFHIEHHRKINLKTYGQNFGVFFSFWDKAFNTFASASGSQQLGLMEPTDHPTQFAARLLYPLYKKSK